MVYLRIQLAATQIFASGWHDQPLGRLALKQRFGDGDKPVKSANIVMRALAFAMLCLPVGALLIVLITDIYTLFIVSPMRTGRSTLLDVITLGCQERLIPCADFWKIAARIGITLVFLLAQLWGSSRMMGFQTATSEILEFTKRWKMKAPVPITVSGRVSTLRQMLSEAKAVSEPQARADQIRRAYIQLHDAWQQAATEVVNPDPTHDPVDLLHTEHTNLNHGWASSAWVVEQSKWLSPTAMPSVASLEAAIVDLEEWHQRRHTHLSSITAGKREPPSRG